MFKNRDKVSLVIDVGSSSVGLALVKLYSKDIPKILFTTRQQMRFQKDLDFQLFMGAMLKALSTGLKTIEKDGLVFADLAKVDDICVVLSSAWHTSRTKTVKREREDSFKFSKKFLEELVQNELEDFKQASNLNNFRGIDSGSVLIDREVVEIKLNGYTTKTPYNQQTSKVEVNIFFSLASKKLLKQIKQVIEKTFNMKKVVFHTFALSSFLAIREAYSNKNNFLIFDITGEITDISLVNSEFLVANASVPIGKNTLLRNISKDLQVDQHDALSLLRMYTDQKLEESVMNNLKDSIARFEKQWSESLYRVLSDLDKDFLLPTKIFFLSNNDLSPVFAEFLKEIKSTDASISEFLFEPEFVNSKILYPYCRYGHSAERDIFLTIEAIFLYRKEDSL
jgi:hypothetical protein